MPQACAQALFGLMCGRNGGRLCTPKAPRHPESARPARGGQAGGFRPGLRRHPGMKKPPRRAVFSLRHRKRDTAGFLARFGGDLLSHVLRRSTIGAAALNGRVRDGIGCFARAMTTKPSKKPIIQASTCMLPIRSLAVTGSDQACRAISTGQLNALLRLHLRPIDEVVYLGPQGYLVLRGASRLDAFSGYPFRT